MITWFLFAVVVGLSMNSIVQARAGGLSQSEPSPFTKYTEEYHTGKRFFKKKNLVEKAEGNRSAYLASLQGSEKFLRVIMME